jgi:phenylacetic acid degradation operon negative regulatory protein
MQPKTEDFLHILLWTTDMLMRPSFRNLTDSYENWAYRNGLFREAAALERRNLLERDPTMPRERIYRLTAQGRLHALGGRDPEERWDRSWDGQWRMVLFDVPSGKNAERERLRRYLRSRSFGLLQKSVWVTPDPLDQGHEILRGGSSNVESLVLLEARPCAGKSDMEIVTGSWDFQKINSRYSSHIETLNARPEGSLSDTGTAAALLKWAAAERHAWLDAVTHDPLLPAKLLPPNYLGQKAWRRRVEVLRAAGRQLRTFPGQ